MHTHALHGTWTACHTCTQACMQTCIKSAFHAVIPAWWTECWISILYCWWKKVIDELKRYYKGQKWETVCRDGSSTGVGASIVEAAWGNQQLINIYIQAFVSDTILPNMLWAWELKRDWILDKHKHYKQLKIAPVKVQLGFANAGGTVIYLEQI